PPAQRPRRIRRPVRAVVVDEHRLPVPTLQRRIQLLHQQRHVRTLVERRDHDCKLELIGNHASSLSTASPISVVDSDPPRSAVRAPAASAAAMAASTFCAASSLPSEWRSSIAAERIAAHGFALPVPAMSGAEPWIGSYMPLSPLQARSEAEGSMPI